MNGWLKVHRKFKEWEWYTDSKAVHLFIHLLLSANHEPKKWRGVMIESGQFITSIESLKAQTGISQQSIRTILKKLCQTGEVTCKATNRFTMVTVCNWASYQTIEASINMPSNKQLTNNQQASNKQLTTNKKDKNYKNEKKIQCNLAPLLKAYQRRYSASPDMNGFRSAIREAVDSGFMQENIQPALDFLGNQSDWKYIPAFNSPNALRDNLPRFYARAQESVDHSEKSRQNALSILSDPIETVKPEDCASPEEIEKASQDLSRQFRRYRK
jgi:predicted transcriptional regulator